MAYAAISKPSLHFNTKLYTGNGSTQSITGVGFQPDWLWIKSRGSTGNHRVHDVVRGVDKQLYPNLTSAEYTYSPNTGVTNFDSDGFSLGSDIGQNTNNETYASWNWKAGGAGSANTDGNTTATVSANTTAGFSIVSWTSNGQEQSIGHGLGATPSMIIMKTRNTGDGWIVGHKDNGWGYYQGLQITNAKISDDRMFSPSGGSDPTNSVWWTNSTAWVTGGTTECIAYCFAEKKGYSKFGSYTGNGNADGTFVYTGFKPAYVLTKSSSTTKHWVCFDNQRANIFNPQNERILVSTNSVAYEDNNRAIDFLSNGFKMRDNGTDSSSTNSSGSTQIYMAFAAEPLVANVGQSIPATAR